MRLVAGRKVVGDQYQGRVKVGGGSKGTGLRWYGAKGRGGFSNGRSGFSNGSEGGYLGERGGVSREGIMLA